MRQRSVQYVMALMICLLVVSHHRCNGVVKAKRDGYEMSLYQRRQAIDYLRNLLGEIDKNIAIKQHLARKRHDCSGIGLPGTDCSDENNWQDHEDGKDALDPDNERNPGK